MLNEQQKASPQGDETSKIDRAHRVSWKCREGEVPDEVENVNPELQDEVEHEHVNPDGTYCLYDPFCQNAANSFCHEVNLDVTPNEFNRQQTCESQKHHGRRGVIVDPSQASAIIRDQTFSKKKARSYSWPLNSQETLNDDDNDAEDSMDGLDSIGSSAWEEDLGQSTESNTPRLLHSRSRLFVQPDKPKRVLPGDVLRPQVSAEIFSRLHAEHARRLEFKAMLLEAEVRRRSAQEKQFRGLIRYTSAHEQEKACERLYRDADVRRHRLQEQRDLYDAQEQMMLQQQFRRPQQQQQRPQQQHEGMPFGVQGDAESQQAMVNIAGDATDLRPFWERLYQEGLRSQARREQERAEISKEEQQHFSQQHVKHPRSAWKEASNRLYDDCQKRRSKLAKQVEQERRIEQEDLRGSSVHRGLSSSSSSAQVTQVVDRLYNSWRDREQRLEEARQHALDNIICGAQVAGIKVPPGAPHFQRLYDDAVRRGKVRACRIAEKALMEVDDMRSGSVHREAQQVQRRPCEVDRIFDRMSRGRLDKTCTIKLAENRTLLTTPISHLAGEPAAASHHRTKGPKSKDAPSAPCVQTDPLAQISVGQMHDVSTHGDVGQAASHFDICIPRCENLTCESAWQDDDHDAAHCVHEKVSIHGESTLTSDVQTAVRRSLRIAPGLIDNLDVHVAIASAMSEDTKLNGPQLRNSLESTCSNDVFNPVQTCAQNVVDEFQDEHDAGLVATRTERSSVSTVSRNSRDLACSSIKKQSRLVQAEKAANDEPSRQLQPHVTTNRASGKVARCSQKGRGSTNMVKPRRACSKSSRPSAAGFCTAGVKMKSQSITMCVHSQVKRSSSLYRKRAHSAGFQLLSSGGTRKHI